MDCSTLTDFRKSDITLCFFNFADSSHELFAQFSPYILKFCVLEILYRMCSSVADRIVTKANDFQ